MKSVALYFGSRISGLAQLAPCKHKNPYTPIRLRGQCIRRRTSGVNVRKLNKLAIIIALAALLSSCGAQRSNAQIAREATPTINALLAAGKANDASAAVKAFTPWAQNQDELINLFAVRREVFQVHQPLPLDETGYTSITVTDYFGNAARLVGPVPGAPGVVFGADMVNDRGWRLTRFELSQK